MNTNISLLTLLLILTTAHTFTAYDKATQAGIHYFHEKKPLEAIDHFEKALEENHENKTALFYLGMIHYYLNNYKESYTYYRKYLKLDPANRGVATNIALVMTKMGSFNAALPIFEQLYAAGETKHAQRLKDFYVRKKDWERASQFMSLDNYWWHDYDLKNKRVLVRVFHGPGMGFGDVFQFIRYAQTIHRAGAHVTLEAPQSLTPLLSLCPYIHRIITHEERTDDFDYVFEESPHVFLLELIKPIPTKQNNDVPYLFASQERIAYWRKQIMHDHTFKIGLCWQSTTMQDYFSDKSAPGPRGIPLSAFAPLKELSGISLYSLQQRVGMDQIQNVMNQLNIKTFDTVDFDSSHGRFMDTAALMMNLDLIITTDTSIAHLAGALGVPVWTILPCESDWRWFLDQSDTPLYPTMRLFRQKTPSDWGHVVQEICTHLKQKLGGSSST